MRHLLKWILLAAVLGGGCATVPPETTSSRGVTVFPYQIPSGSIAERHLTSGVQAKLNNAADVSGLAEGSVLFMGDDGTLSEDGSSFVWDSVSKYLAIGTDSPLAPLYIYDEGATNGRGQLQIVASTASQNTGLTVDGGSYTNAIARVIANTGTQVASVILQDKNDPSHDAFFGLERGSSQVVAGATRNDVVVVNRHVGRSVIVGTTSGTGSGPGVAITGDRNVAVGHTAPDTRLDVNGAITAREVSADPANPDEGASVVWLSDGTGTGADGTLVGKNTFGGATQTFFLNGAYAEIYLSDGTTAQSIPTGDPVKMTGFTTDGISRNVTADVANDKITVVYPGVYKVSVSVSFSSSLANIIWYGSVFVGGVEQVQCHFDRKVGTAGDVGSASISCLIDVATAAQDIEMRIGHDNVGSVNFTPAQADLDVVFVGGT